MAINLYIISTALSNWWTFTYAIKIKNRSRKNLMVLVGNILQRWFYGLFLFLFWLLIHLKVSLSAPILITKWLNILLLDLNDKCFDTSFDLWVTSNNQNIIKCMVNPNNIYCYWRLIFCIIFVKTVRATTGHPLTYVTKIICLQPNTPNIKIVYLKKKIITWVKPLINFCMF